MLQKFGVKTLSLENVFSTISKSQNPTQAQSMIEIAKKYDENHIQAVRKIQRFWRYVYSQIREKRKLMKIPQGGLTVYFKIICKQYPVSKNMRDFFTSKKFELHEIYRIQSAAAKKIQRRAVDLACIFSQDQFETINEIIVRVCNIEQAPNNVATNISLDHLQKLTRKKLADVQIIFRMIENVLRKMKKNMREVLQLLKTIE